MRRREPSAAERALADAVPELVPGGRHQLLYARVDLVPGADGVPLLLELELTEPSLFSTATPRRRIGWPRRSRLPLRNADRVARGRRGVVPWRHD